ncbi:MAG TPA: PEGA domain-containing protein [Kofleriaceae bacterium]|nr:PEGA domain-containing protein [Kofleriaceae bacterium]
MASILALGAVAGSARADDTPAPRAEEAAAQQHLDRGIEAFRRGDFPRARTELAAARDLVPDKPNPYRWLALTDVQLGECTRAIENIDRFVERVVPTDNRLPELARLREYCARTGVLRVTTTPPAATLHVDGALVGTTPFRGLAMRAGTHALVVDKPGFEPARRSVIVPAGGELDVRLALSPPHTPITRRWWFWASAAGAVVLASATIYLATSDEPTVLPPITCDPAGCGVP